MGEIRHIFGRKNLATAEGRENENGPSMVEIVRHVPDREPIIFVRCELVDGKVVLTGIEEDKDQEEKGGVQNILESLKKGVFSAVEKRDVYPKDGQKFLSALLENYDHPYLLARVTR